MPPNQLEEEFSQINPNIDMLWINHTIKFNFRWIFNVLPVLTTLGLGKNTYETAVLSSSFFSLFFQLRSDSDVIN